VSGTASSDYALKVMTVVALIFTPLVLLYQGWNLICLPRPRLGFGRGRWGAGRRGRLRMAGA
jgi:hypothetical protein